MDLLGTIWFWTLAALGFGFVIFIHELGHFLFAKWAGVRVDRFSIGFGPVILRKQIGETEYALSLLPLGGYVKMLGQEDLPSEIDSEAKVDPKSYLSKSWWWQTLILLGGVLFNLISSYIIILGIVWYGKPTAAPVIGSMATEIADEQGARMPSAAVRLGLRQGDRILTINGDKIRDFDGVQMAVISNGRDPIVMEVERIGADGQPQRLRLPAEGPGIPPDPDFKNGRPTLGIRPIAGTTIVDVAAASPSPSLELPRIGEHITAINGQAVPKHTNGQQLENLLLPLVGSTVSLSLDSDRTVSIPYAGNTLDQGLMCGFPAMIAHVMDGADPNGLKAGDIVVAVDGKPVAGQTGFIAASRALINEDRSFVVRVWRSGMEQDITVRARDVYGRRLIGADITMASGFLPVLPDTFDGKPSPLAEAGVIPGDAIIDYTRSNDILKPFEIATVSGGKRVLIPLSEKDAIALNYVPRSGLFSKLFGGTKTSVLASMQGRQVAATNDGVLEMKTRDGSAVTVSPRGLSEWNQILAGLQQGDWVIGIVPLPDGGHALDVMRGASAPVSHTVTPRDPGVAILFEPVAMHIYEPEHWTEAFVIANTAAYNMIVKTLQIIPKFFQSTEQGGLDPNKSLTGPIGIFNMLKGSVERFGFIKYLELMALIGLNLFLINLLPIPITDGGQLMFLWIETATGKQLAPWARNLAMWIGLLLVLFLMVYVIGLDVLRLSGVL